MEISAEITICWDACCDRGLIAMKSNVMQGHLQSKEIFIVALKIVSGAVADVRRMSAYLFIKFALIHLNDVFVWLRLFAARPTMTGNRRKVYHFQWNRLNYEESEQMFITDTSFCLLLKLKQFRNLSRNWLSFRRFRVLSRSSSNELNRITVCFLFYPTSLPFLCSISI